MDGIELSSKREFIVSKRFWNGADISSQTIFADDTYSKPYFVTYVNSSFFSVLLILVGLKRLWASGGSISGAIRGESRSTLYSPIFEDEQEAFVKPVDEGDSRAENRSPRSRLLIEDPVCGSIASEGTKEARLNVRETAWLSFEFCILWV